MIKDAIVADQSFEINYIDQSGLTEFTRCPAKYFFSRLMGFTFPEDTRIAPDFGTCMHRALPYAYSDLDKAMKEFIAEWQRLGYSDGDSKRNVDRARLMLEDFASQRSNRLCPYEILHFPISAPTKDIISPNEVPFLLDIGGSLPLAGRIDAMVRWKQSKEIWALDYKNSSEISSRFFSCFSASPQACLYALAACQIAGVRVAGMIIEALRVSEKNTETQLFHVFVSDYNILSMKDFTNRTADRIIKCNEDKIWPKNLSMCSPYGAFGHPGRVCKYKQLCTMCDDWHDLARMYKKCEPFHPFEVVKEIDK